MIGKESTLAQVVNNQDSGGGAVDFGAMPFIAGSQRRHGDGDGEGVIKTRSGWEQLHSGGQVEELWA
ncbi:hypothetical protein SESBI_29593 [Sesbania bispinosa]|nr:hypothetical protein SESBI_29593 [Sesbania bispinosa]